MPAQFLPAEGLAVAIRLSRHEAIRSASRSAIGALGTWPLYAPLTRSFAGYTLSDDPARLDLAEMHAYLRGAYWSEGIPREVLERAVQGSLCIGAYAASGAQIGLARFISDFATFCYVCDVYVLDEHRGRGVAREMLAMALAHPRLEGLRRWNLVTRDGHALYRGSGFAPLAQPDRHMERTRPNFYKNA